MQRKMWREGHRRSPRICALDARKDQPSRPDPVAQSRRSTISTTSSSTNTGIHVERKAKKPHLWGKSEGPASRTRAKKKRKLRPLRDVASPHTSPQDSNSSDKQDGRQTSSEDCQINCDPPILQSKNGQKYDNPGQHHIGPCVSWMPDKRILELVVDILQRRDTHEIFAEPVDPNEVEDYYEIIKEPMDFGTMRAKLHEGMYHNLEQFEHDVFLISRNAMHFNSSGTIYFRQARAIDELAKKVFHLLKTDPENFEINFSGTRRRTNRKLKGEARSTTNSLSSKLAANSRYDTVAVNISRKSMLSAASSALNLRTAMRVIPGFSGSGITAQSDAIDDEMPFGGGDGKGSSSSEADRRSSYKPSLSVLSENYSIVSPFYNYSKLLIPVNRQDIGYRESLMRFTKDLGPTAQMIAKRKLNGFSTEATESLNSGLIWPNSPKCNKFVTSSFDQQPLTAMDTAITIKKSQNLSSGRGINMCDDDKGERAYSGDKMRFCGTSFESVSHGNNRCSVGAIKIEGRSSIEMESIGISKSDNFQVNQNSNIQTGLDSSITDARDLNFSLAGLNNEGENSTKLKQDKSKMDLSCHLNGSERRLVDNYYSLSPCLWPLETTAAGISGFGQTLGSMGYCHQAVGATHELGSSSKTMTPVSQFIFDLSFLKTRFDQMNSFGQDRFLQQSSGAQRPFMTETYHDKHTYSSLDTQFTNLALQLRETNIDKNSTHSYIL